MNGKDNTADRATRLPLLNMAENTTHTEGGHGLDHGVHTTDTELRGGKCRSTVQDCVTVKHILSNKTAVKRRYKQGDC